MQLSTLELARLNSFAKIANGKVGRLVSSLNVHDVVMARLSMTHIQHQYNKII